MKKNIIFNSIWVLFSLIVSANLYAENLILDYKGSKVTFAGTSNITKEQLLTESKLIDIADRRFEKKWQQKDPKGISNEYTENGVFMKPGKPPRIGKSAIADEFSKSVKTVDRVKFFQDELIFFEGLESAYQRAHMLGYVDNKESPIFKGSYIILWKKINGQWLIHHDMFNSDEIYDDQTITYIGKDNVSRKEILKQANLISIADRRFEEKWKKKDYVGISEEYTADGIFLKPGTPPRIGRKEIAEEFKKSVSQISHVEFFQDELEFQPGMKAAFQRAHMTGYVKGRDYPVFFGSYTILWKKVNKEWLIQYDMFNADH